MTNYSKFFFFVNLTLKFNFDVKQLQRIKTLQTSKEKTVLLLLTLTVIVDKKIVNRQGDLYIPEQKLKNQYGK